MITKLKAKSQTEDCPLSAIAYVICSRRLQCFLRKCNWIELALDVSSNNSLLWWLCWTFVFWYQSVYCSVYLSNYVWIGANQKAENNAHPVKYCKRSKFGNTGMKNVLTYVRQWSACSLCWVSRRLSEKLRCFSSSQLTAPSRRRPCGQGWWIYSTRYPVQSSKHCDLSIHHRCRQNGGVASRVIMDIRREQRKLTVPISWGRVDTHMCGFHATFDVLKISA
jgi:hypothetical protein